MQTSTPKTHPTIITWAYDTATLCSWLRKLYPGKVVRIVGTGVEVDTVRLKGLEVREKGRTVELWTA